MPDTGHVRAARKCVCNHREQLVKMLRKFTPVHLRVRLTARWHKRVPARFRFDDEDGF